MKEICLNQQKCHQSEFQKSMNTKNSKTCQRWAPALVFHDLERTMAHLGAAANPIICHHMAQVSLSLLIIVIFIVSCLQSAAVLRIGIIGWRGWGLAGTGVP